MEGGPKAAPTASGPVNVLRLRRYDSKGPECVHSSHWLLSTGLFPEFRLAERSRAEEVQTLGACVSPAFRRRLASLPSR